MSSQADVTVSRLGIECHVPIELSHRHAVADRLTKIARNGLGDALQESLRPLQSGGDEIVLIRRLELDMEVDLLLGEREIAAVWATKFKTALLKSLRSAGNAEIVLFADPAAYLASALGDIAAGRARELWYYRRFNGLWALPVSAALRTALLDVPYLGIEALKRLHSRAVMELCTALNNGDALRIVTALFPALLTTPARQTDVEVFAGAVVDDFTLARSLGRDEAPQKLMLAILALRKAKELEPAVIGICAHYLSLLMDLQEGHPQHFAQLVDLLADRRGGELKRCLPAEKILQLQPLMLAGESVVRCVARLLLPRENRPEPATSTVPVPNGFTWFGNALILLPHINALPLPDFTTWAALEEQSPQRVLRWLVLCVCQGADKFYAAAQDTLLRDLCGIAPGIALADVAKWLNQQWSPLQSTELFSALQGELAPEDGPLTRRQWQRGDHQVVAHNECRKGRWIKLVVEHRTATMVAIPQALSDDDHETAASDFERLWPATRWGFSDSVRAVLVTLAQFTLKSVAYRLPGFANCSVDYLLRNFLAMSATLVAEPRHINAHLSRVPMSVILNMAGLNRSSVLLPDFDQREIRLMESK